MASNFHILIILIMILIRCMQTTRTTIDRLMMLFVLRRTANACKGRNDCMRANRCASINDHMGLQLNVVVQDDIYHEYDVDDNPYRLSFRRS